MSNAVATNVTEIVDTYLESLGEPDPARRAAMVERAWAPAGRYVDPPRDLSGYEAIEAAIFDSLGRHPGGTFRRTTPVDAHHEYARFGWEFAGADGAILLTGLDIAVVAEDGRLSTIIGFFGDQPKS